MGRKLKKYREWFIVVESGPCGNQHELVASYWRFESLVTDKVGRWCVTREEAEEHGRIYQEALMYLRRATI